MIYGVDVSNYQPINFTLTTPGDGHRVDFVIIKVTEGTGYVNPKWASQRQWARDHGLSVGFYHFVRPGSMVDQADYFLDKVALQPGDHLWFDWEDSGVSSSQKDAWISYVQGRAPGHRVGLYCNTSYWKTRDTSSFAGDGLWIATGGIPAGSPPIEAPWLIHQYSTSGNYDHDLAQFSSKNEMIAWAEGNEDMALSAEDKTWITNAITNVVKAEVYNQVWVKDQMGPPAGQATDTNQVWQAQSLLRYAGERADSALTQSAANSASLTEIKALLAAVDLSGIPDAIADKIAALKLNITITEGP